MLTEVFPCFFLSCKANARVKLTKTGHGPHSSTLFVICVVRLLFVLFCVLFVCKFVLPPGDNPNYLLTPWSRVLLEKLTDQMQLINISKQLYCLRGRQSCWTR
jgi:hypothetical protein